MINVTLGKIPEDFARITCDNVDPGGSIDGQLEKVHQDFARITCDNVDPGECQSTVTLGRMQGLPVDNVDPGWGIDSYLGQDP